VQPRELGAPKLVRILVGADIRLYREGLSRLLQGDEIQVVGAADSRRQVLRLTAEQAPDVLVIDMSMSESLATARDVARDFPATEIVALSVPEDDVQVMACAQAGISAFVAREASIDDLRDAVLRAARGESCCPPRLARGLLRQIRSLGRSRTDTPDLDLRLTQRELQVASLIARGFANKEIAQELRIETSTVKNHVHNILEKLELRRRGEIGAAVRRSAPPDSLPRVQLARRI
jgi:DNA-binding NarL/FixJ family response regulator